MVFHRKRKTKKVKCSAKEKKCIKRELKLLMRPREEVKYAFGSLAALDCDKDQGGASSCYFGLLDIVSPGTGDSNNRIGDKIFLKSIKMRFYTQMTQNQATVNNVCIFRFIMVQVKEPLNTSAAIGSSLKAIYSPALFLTPGQDSTNYDPVSQYNHDRKKEYNFLYDKTWTQATNGNVAGSSLNNSIIKDHVININMKKVRKQIEYINGSTTLAIGHILCVCLTQNTNAATNFPLFYGTFKVDFIDT